MYIIKLNRSKRKIIYIKNSSKGRNYSLFKEEIKLESYISTLNGPVLYAMIRFRTDNHKMPVETGRW